MQFEDNLKARMEAGEHPTLYGYSDTVQKELTSVKEVAEFIYTEGLKGDVLITTSDGTQRWNAIHQYLWYLPEPHCRYGLP